MSNSASPLVSVIILCYNHAPYVIETLESFWAQTYRHTELIIVDDCSKDNSVAVIENWLRDHQLPAVFIRHQTNQGVCRCLNDALAAVKGKYISLIAADDAWIFDKIASQVEIMEVQPEQVAVLYTDAYQMDAQGQLFPKTFMKENHPLPDQPTGNIFPYLWRGNFIPAMTTLIRTSCFATVGNYDESLSFEDWDMWLRIAKKFHFIYSPKISAKYRILATSMTRSRTAQVVNSEYLIRLKWMEQEKSVVWPGLLFSLADELYKMGHPKRHKYLWKAFLAEKQRYNFKRFWRSICGISYGRTLRAVLLGFFSNLRNRFRLN